MQIAYSFDKITQSKILKGAGIAAVGAVITFLAGNLGLVEEAFKAYPVLAMLSTALISIAFNAWREYQKGV
jgi:hypothetical protein